MIANAARKLLTTVVAGLLLATAVHAAEEFRVGVSLGLTGRYAGPAKMHERAYRLWEKQVNDRGGILGRPVKLIIRDDRSDENTAREIYRELISKQRVDMVFGPYSSRITVSVIPIVEKFDYPMIVPGAAADKIWSEGFTNVLGILPPASRYSVGMFELAVELDLQRVAVVHADDEFSSGVGEGANITARRLDLDVVMLERFKKGMHDLVPLAEEAKRANAQLIIVGGHFDEAVDMRRALSAINWYPEAYFASIGPALPEYQAMVGQNVDLAFASSIWEPGLDYPGSQEFEVSFEEAYGDKPSYQAATAYAACQVVESAIERAHGFDKHVVREALYDLDTYTVIGRYHVDRTGMQIRRVPLIIQWQGGRKEIVWPKQIRTAEPILRR